MHRQPSFRSITADDLRQHFHNYFELLLGTERSKLQQAIVCVSTASQHDELLNAIDCRIDYLRGAVKMAKLLCLINQDEAKSSFVLLSAERERLRASLLRNPGRSPCASEPSSSSARIESIKSLLHSNAPS